MFSLALLIGCAGAGLEEAKGRAIAVFNSPEDGQKLVLVGELELLRKMHEEPGIYREANEADMTSSEQAWAVRKLITGGSCHITGRIIPPLPEENARSAWACRVRYAYQDLLPLTPEWSFEPRLEAAIREVAGRYPALSPFEDSKWLDWVRDKERSREEMKTEESARKAQEQGEASPEGSTSQEPPPAPVGPVLAPEGAAGI